MLDLNRMSITTSIYVLHLEHGKYYVGESKDPVKTAQEHAEGLGPFWTQVHHPTKQMEVAKGKQRSELDQYVKMTMRKYGIENVRGGSWENARLTDTQRQALHDELADSSCLIS